MTAPARFVGIGDLHLAPGPRNADRIAAFDFVINDAATAGAPISAWLVLGDLNDARMSIDDRNVLVDRFELMADVAPVLTIKGNHDLEDELDFLAHLKTTWPIVVVTGPEVVRLELATGGDAAIFCLPYPSKANIVAAGFAHDQIARVFHESMDVIFMEAAAKLDAARRDGLLTGCIGHLTIAGAIASTGQPQIGNEMSLSVTHLQRLGACFKVFGHVHKHQQIDSAIYAGSLCRLDWGETEEKGWVEILAENTSNARQKSWMHAWHFMPIPVAPMFHIEGTLTRDRFDWRCTKGPNGPRDEPPSTRRPCPACQGTGQRLYAKETTDGCDDCDATGVVIDWAGCDVRVRPSYALSEREVIGDALARIEREFGTARRLEVEPIGIPERALRAPEVVNAVTLDEKLRAWAKLAGVSWSDLIALKAHHLQSTDDGEQIVAAVRAQLDEVLTGEHWEPIAEIQTTTVPELTIDTRPGDVPPPASDGLLF